MSRQNAGPLGLFSSLLLLGFLALAAVALSSCGAATPPAPPLSYSACTLGMQARGQYQGQSSFGVGNVITAGTMTSIASATNCGGSATTFSGLTSAFGVDNHTEVRFNAYWDVTWDWLQTPYSGCGIYGAGPTLVPDSGHTFVDTCSL